MSYYRTYSDYLKQTYGEKVYKLPIALPLTCPNRDGTCGRGGCTFCGEIGAGYENLPAEWTVTEQIERNIEHIAPKYKARKYIPYFQNFSNTYLAPEDFARYTEEAARHPAVVGIAVATRPDCIHPVYLDILSNLRQRYGIDITVELGLQTVNPHSLVAVHRGHTVAEYIDAVLQIAPYGFSVCTHVIVNLPWDDMVDVIETAKIISALPTHQVKIHALYIVKNTPLAAAFERGEVQLCTAAEYVERVVTFLEYLRPDIVLQRVVGRAPEEATLFANWGRGWWVLRDKIEAEFAARNSRQGSRCDYLGGKAVRRWTMKEDT